MLVLVFFLFFSPGIFAVEALVEGQQYVLVKSPQATKVDKGKVEVREFFWYGCPHCYTLEPYIETWLTKKPAYVTFVRSPAILGAHWERHARVFYALQSLGKSESLHRKFFDALHKDRMVINDTEQIADFFASQGVPREQFMRSMKSLSVDLKIKNVHKLAKSYRLRSVPVFVIDGKYMTAPSMLKCTELVTCYRDFFAVVNTLAEKARKAKQQ